MYIIQDFLKLINSNLKRDFLVYISLIFCLFAGFALGRVSKISEIKPDLKFASFQEDLSINPNINDSDSTNTPNNMNEAGASIDKSLIFASSKGKYFYYKGCGGNTISPKNLVYYKSEQDALAKGKILYSKCK
jgi:hypothetical protein